MPGFARLLTGSVIDRTGLVNKNSVMLQVNQVYDRSPGGRHCPGFTSH